MTVTIAKMLPKDKYEAKFVLVDKNKGNISKIFKDLSCLQRIAA